MPRDPAQVVWDFVQAWLAKADGDLHAARALLASPAEDHFAAAFHAQQAAEKYLKAFLVRHQIPFPKTHDVGRLLELCAQADLNLSRELGEVDTLTPYGVEYRYPVDAAVSEEEAGEAIRLATSVRDTVKECLRGYLEVGRPAGRRD